MRLRRICLLVFGFTISAGICGTWFAFQQGMIPVVKGYAEEISLPMFVQDTELLAEELVSYEGEYIEDTEFGEYVFVSGIILRNTSDKGILRAKVKLVGKSGILEFDATYIPPGEAVLVLEKNRKESADRQFYACTGTVEYDESDWLEHDGVQLGCLDNNQIEIINTTDKMQRNIQVYYKTAYPEWKFYVGGITYCYRISMLPAGESITVSPEYFVSNCSQIVYVKTEKVMSIRYDAAP